MNSLERIKAAVEFRKPDRVPVIAQVFGHAAAFSGVYLLDYLQNGETLARSQLKSLKHYDYDAVFALMDVSVETEAAGSFLTYRHERYPTVKSYAFSKKHDLDAMKVPDPKKAGRMPELLKACRILRKEVGNDVLVVGCVIGPMTLALQLMGAEKALFLAVDEPDVFAGILDYATEVIIRYGLEQIEAGAHLPIVFNPSASPEIIPHSFFREFELPRLEKIFSAFKKQGAAAGWLHIAGAVQPIMPYYPKAGVTIANIDYCINPAEAMAVLPKTCLNGNIKPLSFVEDTPDSIFEASKKLLECFDQRGGFILSSGCEIPPESKFENIKAMVDAAR